MFMANKDLPPYGKAFAWAIAAAAWCGVSWLFYALVSKVLS